MATFFKLQASQETNIEQVLALVDSRRTSTSTNLCPYKMCQVPWGSMVQHCHGILIRSMKLSPPNVRFEPRADGDMIAQNSGRDGSKPLLDGPSNKRSPTKTFKRASPFE
jgi:hypothetical protein